MPIFTSRWMTDYGFFVSARTQAEAIVMLDQWDNAEAAAIIDVRDFLLDDHCE